MQTTLIIEARSVFGNTLFYPACDQSKRLASIAGAQTLALHKLFDAQAMGFDIKAVGDVRGAAHLMGCLDRRTAARLEKEGR